MHNDTYNIAVVGLGYVGLPLAVHLAKHFPCTGFDINTSRVDELKEGIDKTEEIDPNLLKESTLTLTHHIDDLKGNDIYIITVPTPVDEQNTPDLTAVKSASTMIGSIINKGAIIVFESTVYPGVTEDICAPLIEEASGLKAGEDFILGYSPERINPGDKIHTVDKITKVVSAQTDAALATLLLVYGKVNGGNVFAAANIKTAEAAKVIENAQRDINIAFVNEITTIFSEIDISIYDVLDAANTKWNFLPFTPGLVGGHCIGVDPYYLAHLAKENGHNPDVILSGRQINEQMSSHIARMIDNRLQGQSKILVLGVTFKENVPDLRNSKNASLVQELIKLGHDVDTFDPHACKDEAKAHLGITLLDQMDEKGSHYHAVVAAVPHDEFKELNEQTLSSVLSGQGLIADIKRVWNKEQFKTHHYWSL